MIAALPAGFQITITEEGHSNARHNLEIWNTLMVTEEEANFILI
jgi:hypothetical protein